jgi:hypothetical protein
MFGIISWIVCLALANFGIEAFREVPNYLEAGKTTWNQLVAVLIYYFIWSKE